MRDVSYTNKVTSMIIEAQDQFGYVFWKESLLFRI